MSGLLLENLQSPWLLLGLWLLGGVIALCGAWIYGQLGALLPQAGGEYLFLSRLYHPLFGFLSGWVSFVVGFSAPIAASSLAFSDYFLRAFPQLNDWRLLAGVIEPTDVKKILSLTIILIFTMIHLRGIEFGAKIQNVLTISKAAILAGAIVIGFTLGRGDWNHLNQGGDIALGYSGWKSIGLSLMWITFAYAGWNASTYIGSEIKNPRVNLPLSLLLGSGVVLTLYAGLNALYIYAIEPAEMSGVLPVGGLAMAKLFGRSMDRIFSIFIAFALFSSISALIILGPRVYYAMAKDGRFFKFAAHVHPRFHVPTKSIALQTAIAFLMVISGTFGQILTYMGFALGIFPLFAVWAIFRLKKHQPSFRQSLRLMFASIFYIVTGMVMLILAFLERPIESSIAIATILAGLPLYRLFAHHKDGAGD